MRTRPLVMTLAVLCAALVAGIGASVPAAAVSQTYIVVLKDSVNSPAQAAAAAGVTPTYVYQHALKGYAAPMSSAKAASIAAKPNVRFVEPDGIATISATQTPATWGLDRIDQRNLPLSNSYTYNATGAGVKAYIIDTGMRLTHVDYGGRAIQRLRLHRQRSERQRLPRARDARRRHGRLDDVRRRQERDARRRPRARLPGQRLYSQIAGVDWVTGNHLAGQLASRT